MLAVRVSVSGVAARSGAHGTCAAPVRSLASTTPSAPLCADMRSNDMWSTGRGLSKNSRELAWRVSGRSILEEEVRRAVRVFASAVAGFAACFSIEAACALLGSIEGAQKSGEAIRCGSGTRQFCNEVWRVFRRTTATSSSAPPPRRSPGATP